MRIKKVINNNILCAVDEKGNELIVTGRGGERRCYQAEQRAMMATMMLTPESPQPYHWAASLRVLILRSEGFTSSTSFCCT